MVYDSIHGGDPGAVQNTPDVSSADMDTTVEADPTLQGTKSTIQLSEKEKTEQAVQANLPTVLMNSLMQTPKSGDDFSISESLNKSSKAVLDSWLKGIEEQSQRIKEELKSPRYRVWVDEHSSAHYAKIERENPQNIAIAEIDRAHAHGLQEQLSMREALSEGIHNFAASASKDQLAYAAASIVVSTTFIGETITNREVPHSAALTVTAFEQIWQNTHSAVADDMRAELGLIGAIFARSLIYPATAEAMTITGASGADAAEKNKNFSRKYAENLTKFVLGNQLDLFLTPMLTHRLGGKEVVQADPSKQEKIKEQILKTKVLLLASTLALHYKLTSDNITGEQFTAVVFGKLQLPLPEELASARRVLNKFMEDLPVYQQNHIIAALEKYIDSNTSLVSMLQPNQVLSDINNILPKKGDLPG